MTDDRPKPRWGEYAETPPAVDYPPPTVPSPAGPPPSSDKPEPPRNTRDILITTALLLLGVFDVASMWSTFSALGTQLGPAFEQQGVGEFTSIALANSVGMWLNIARAAILVVTIIVSLVLISRGRRAFWVPLVGGVLAAIVLLVLVSYVILNDPAFMQYVGQSRG
ncbi:hypothetical protein HDC94_001273 [Leifsonia sp. AK011]|uniref:DUF6264 family protein n=1 Tax=Leifsonia sp. AK011 TaxID=2723075 RepID=UPI0015CE880A|nr:DUF6264 family protein [Leifsonia sp. AK011]NYF10117.1 hypothetical protein [Leifsonia sp. AK011]